MSKVYKDESEWQKLLDDESYRVTRQSGTERPFTGKYWDFNKEGMYKCICCGENLFESKTTIFSFFFKSILITRSLIIRAPTFIA